ncbi:MAG: DUF885 domain-containing protein [Pseudomonadota bacterium]
MSTSLLDKLHQLANDYWKTEAYYEPIQALLAGLDPDDTTLFRLSPKEQDERVAVAANLLQQLNDLPLDNLRGQDAATAAMLHFELSIAVRLHQCGAHLKPSLFPVGPEFMTVFWANGTTFDSKHDAVRYTERLRSIPKGVEGLKEALRLGVERGHRYPQQVLDRAIDVVKGTLADDPERTAWFSPFIRSPISARLGVERGEAKRVIAAEVIPAIQSYADFLAEEIMLHARNTVSTADDPHGEDFYNILVERFTSKPMTAEDVAALGRAEVARLAEAFDQLAADHGFANADALHAAMADPDRTVCSSPEELLVQIESLAKKIDAKIPAYFGRLPRITYGVAMMPEAQSQKMPPAYAQPAPPGGSQAGLFWVSGIPTKCPTTMHVPLVLHEAWPGHLMHLALCHELEELPEFRRYGAVKYTACVEGWALYCEELGLDMGFYEKPEDHYGRIDMAMWRAVRLVVDTGLHAYGWSRDQAIDYMNQHLSLDKETIEAEIDRYIALPGQALAYQVGGLHFSNLRRSAEEAMGETFSLRSFHDAITGAGTVPLPVLTDLVEETLGIASSHAR